MRAVRTTLGVGAVVLGLMAAGSFAAAPPSNNKKGHHVVSGTVVEVDRSKDRKGHGVLKVRAHHNNKAAGKAKSEHVVTIHVNAHTRFEKDSHTGKGKGGTTCEVLAHFHDVEPGTHVRVKLDHNHHAQEVAILTYHAGKNKTKK